MRVRSRWTVALAAVIAAVVLSSLPAIAGQEEQFTPEYKEVRSAFDPKHTPRIVAPDRVKRGEWFDVTITVGAGGDHPSLGEHFVRYIALRINLALVSRRSGAAAAQLEGRGAASHLDLFEPPFRVSCLSRRRRW